MPVNSRRRQHLRKQRLQKARSRKTKQSKAVKPTQIIARNPLDIYNLGSTLSSEVEPETNCVITTYNELKDPSLIVTKYVYKTTPTTLKSLAADYNKLYTRVLATQESLYKSICCNDNYEPAGFIVQKRPQAAGSLCTYADKTYTQGTQIGKNDQGGQDADALYLEKSDDSLIIKRLTGEGNTNPGEAFRAIYSEIKLTKKAGQALADKEQVGPNVVYTTIVSDSNLMPVGYIVMERIIGKYLSEAEVRTHATEIHKLIDILYDNGITHNDLHNRNILKGYTESLQAKEPRIYIIDYGSSLIGKPPIEQKKREYRIAITFEGGNTHRSYKTFVTV
jgi:hypothetical protein